MADFVSHTSHIFHSILQPSWCYQFLHPTIPPLPKKRRRRRNTANKIEWHIFKMSSCHGILSISNFSQNKISSLFFLIRFSRFLRGYNYNAFIKVNSCLYYYVDIDASRWRYFLFMNIFFHGLFFFRFVTIADDKRTHTSLIIWGSSTTKAKYSLKGFDAELVRSFNNHFIYTIASGK